MIRVAIGDGVQIEQVKTFDTLAEATEFVRRFNADHHIYPLMFLRDHTFAWIVHSEPKEQNT